MAYKVGKITRPVNGEGNAEVTLTATIKKGTTVQATKVFNVEVRELGMSDTQCVANDKAALDIADKAAIKSNISLPTAGANGTTITWASATPAVVSVAGIVTRPANGGSNANVNLTATIKKGSITETKIIAVTVLPWTDAEEVEIAFNAINWDLIKGSNVNDQSIISNLTLSSVGLRGTIVTWGSSAAASISTTGAVTRPAYANGDSVVSLTVTVEKNGIESTKQLLNLKVLKLAQTNDAAADLALAAITDDTIKGSNDLLSNVIANLTLANKYSNSSIEYANGVQITWTSSNTVNLQIVGDGTTSYVGSVVRDGVADKTITLTMRATATSPTGGGVVEKTKTFTVIVKKSV